MTVSLSSPITGAAQTGFTSPTYTLTTDTPPDVNAKQWAVTALGGTQTGVVTHSVAAPFTLTTFRPKVFQTLPVVNPVTGQLTRVPKNTYQGILVRKGVLPLAGQSYQVALARAMLDIPAGADTADAANLRAMISALIGALNQVSAGLGDTVVSGVI